uniref:Uncharacterized protein n=1 Tax=Hyaloperonospora arabidopsidis (strain Emoy2) TaxID=559515 RepID=M4B8L3_HYAAE
MAPYNQLKPEEVGRIKGLREAGLISTISSVLRKKTKKSKKPVNRLLKLFDGDTRRLIRVASKGQAKSTKLRPTSS